MPTAQHDPALVDDEQRTWASLSHLTALLGYLVAFGQFIPPLILYLTKRNKNPFIADQALESLNFQINVVLCLVVGTILTMTIVLAWIGIPMLILTTLGNVIFVIIATVRAREGELYRYPVSVRCF